MFVSMRRSLPARRMVSSHLPLMPPKAVIKVDHEAYFQVAEQFRITPQQTPVLICGDLNSLPDSGS